MIEEKMIKLVKKAIKYNEVPVAALIIKNNKVIAKAYNQRERKNDVLAHAEVIAIKKASKKLKTWKLNDCILYTSMKPCKMCVEIIKQTRIKKVYYILENTKNFTQDLFIEKIDSSLEKNFEIIIKEFFKKMRIKDKM